MLRLIARLQDRVVASGSFSEVALLRIGRADDTDLRIENLAVSSYHAEIACVGGVYELRDLDSSNGTFVNGRRVARRNLNDGDVIGVGKFVVSVALEQPAPAAPAIGDMARYLRLSQTDRLQVQALAPRDAPGAAAHLLVAGRAEAVGLREGALLVGGARDCDLVVRGLRVPPRLALIARGHGGFSLLSLAPRVAMVRRDGQRVDRRVWLQDGDRLQLGRLQATFHEGAPARRRRSPA